MAAGSTPKASSHRLARRAIDLVTAAATPTTTRGAAAERRVDELDAEFQVAKDARVTLASSISRQIES